MKLATLLCIKRSVYTLEFSIDHAHEKNNKCVKGDGGATGLTENLSELLRWRIAGPQIARIIAEFELSKDIRSSKTKCRDTLHHEQSRSAQSKFEQQVHALCDTMEKIGNPFTEDNTDLLLQDSGDIADPEVIESIRKVEKLGQEQFNNFVETQLEKETTSLVAPITKNKLQLFSNQKKRTAPKEKLQIESLKKMCTLFAQFYVSCLVQGRNMDEFFRHENQPHPPSLSQFGELRQGTKSDLVHCFGEKPATHH